MEINIPTLATALSLKQSESHKSLTMLFWFTLLALAMHITSILWLSKPAPANLMATPKPITVTLLPVPVKKPEIEPIKPTPIEEPKKKPPPPKAKLKPAPKPIPKVKPEPVVKPKPLVKTAPMAKALPPEAKAVDTIAPILPAAPVAPVKQASTNTQTHSAAKAAPTQSSAASSHHNLDGDADGKCTPDAVSTPQPRYPQSAKNRHLEGRVFLSFTITTEGHTDNVSVTKSSGHDILDEAAINAVSKWKYNTTRPCKANKSINFNLTD